ncbi:MAG TPA: hypothetical protein VGD45_07750 [Steroidobacter sp.]|uniref:hypothetical protein n=1 Tax=Steroidobacter sp. TaxID=1978227 RepID=UPI002EDA933B
MKTAQIHHRRKMVYPNDLPEMAFDVLVDAADLLLRELALDLPSALSGISSEREILRGCSP